MPAIGILDSLWRQWNGSEDINILNLSLNLVFNILFRFAIVSKFSEFFKSCSEFNDLYWPTTLCKSCICVTWQIVIILWTFFQRNWEVTSKFAVFRFWSICHLSPVFLPSVANWSLSRLVDELMSILLQEFEHWFFFCLVCLDISVSQLLRLSFWLGLFYWSAG